jgi:hypothetical protein
MSHLDEGECPCPRASQSPPDRTACPVRCRPRRSRRHVPRPRCPQSRSFCATRADVRRSSRPSVAGLGVPCVDGLIAQSPNVLGDGFVPGGGGRAKALPCRRPGNRGRTRRSDAASNMRPRLPREEERGRAVESARAAQDRLGGSSCHRLFCRTVPTTAQEFCG